MDNSEFLRKARETIKSQLSVDDLVTKLVELVDETEKAENTLFKAVYDAYFLYFPEAAALMQDRDVFIRTVSVSVLRGDVAKILSISSDSMGYDFDDGSIQLMTSQVNELNNLAMLMNMAKKHLEDTMFRNYPNLTTIAESMVGARLLQLGNGINKLAFMPSSKIQVLGAEKALFQRRRGQKASPKYGVIFKNPLIEGSAQDVRGKIARALSSKISLAAKTDFFSKEDKSEAIRKELTEEIKRITDGAKKSNR